MALRRLPKRSHFRPLVALSVSVVLGLALPATASATIIRQPPWADIMSGSFWDFLDTRADADSAVNYLSGMGYYAFDDDSNTTPTQALGPYWAQSDSVWAAMGHGTPGQICINNGGQLGVVLANSTLSPTSSCNSVLPAAMHSMPANTLSQMKLMAFISCYSAVDGNAGSPMFGNLLKEAVWNQGADSAIGFYGEIIHTQPIPFPPDTEWLWNDAFWHSLALGSRIDTAWYAGLQNIYTWWHAYYGFNDVAIYGGFVTIAPAAYGN
jgi:hypothetical protein